MLPAHVGEDLAMGVTPGEARAIARGAYVFLYPLVANYSALHRQAIDASSPSFGGGFGRWQRHWETTVAKSDLSQGRQSTRTLCAWLDLSSGPRVFMDRRTSAEPGTVTRWVDLWGMAITEEPGSRRSRHGAVVVVPPMWTGAVPADVGVILRSETTVVRVCRVMAASSAGASAPISNDQLESVLLPVGTEVGDEKKRSSFAETEWYVCGDGVLTAEEFWGCSCFALTLTRPHPDDRAVLDRLAEIGVAAGVRWDAGQLGAAAVAAIEAGMDDAITDLLRAASFPRALHDRYPSREDFDSDYLNRALGTLESVSAF